MDENSESLSSSASENSQQPDVYEVLEDDGNWLVSVRYDALGNIEGYEAVPYTGTEALITSAIEARDANQMDALESVPCNAEDIESFDAYQTTMMTIGVVEVFALFAIIGAVASRTLLRSMERK